MSLYTACTAPAGAARSRARALVALVLMGAAAGAACGRSEARPGAEAAIAQRQREGLQRLVQEAEQGTVVRPGDVMVVVDERLVQDLLAPALPLERVVGGRYRVRITRATVRFEDGFALVRLGGQASLAGREEGYASAELDVAGGLDVVELDPRTGRLRGQVKVIAVDARRLDVMGVGAPREARRLVEDLGRERLEAFSDLLSSLEIPVRVERELQLPAVTGEAGLRIGAAVVPLHAAIVDVEAFRGRLWVSIQAGVEASP
ncbi:MAG TPA: hypothetical protein VFO85_13220 [Vicinamibacteria bacterium]|nr:hypothetical protein [Vicinamibacteria bacterium]